MNTDFTAIILGSDINAYSMVRCHHESFGKKVLMLGKDALGVTKYSSIINFQKINNFGNEDVFVQTLNKIAEASTSRILLIATSDSWVKLLVENKEKLNSKFTFNYPNLNIVKNLLSKENFYNAYKDEFVKLFPDCLVTLPKTFIYSCSSLETNQLSDLDRFVKVELNNQYPIILKPSNGVEYYKNSFVGQAKVYKLQSHIELLEIIEKIKTSGYRDTLIIQEFIQGGDEGLCDVIMYANSKSKVEFSTFAQIALQERTPTGVGNCTVLINGFNEYVGKEETEKIVTKLKTFLENIGYAGFAEFDLKYDPQNKNFKLFEINPRQARSSYYLSSLGENMVKVLVDDLIFNIRNDFKFLTEKVVLSFVPKYVIENFIESEKIKSEILENISLKKLVRPLNYNKDFSIKRFFYLLLKDYKYIRKYKTLKW